MSNPYNSMSFPPTSVTNAEKEKLIKDLKHYEDSCLVVKGAVQSIVSATLASCSNNDSDSESVVTVINSGRNISGDQRSLDSIHEIVSDDEMSRSDSEEEVDISDKEDGEEKNAVIDEDIPGLNKLLELISKGKVKLPDKVLSNLNELNLKMNALTQASSELQDRWHQIINTLEMQDKKIDGVNQYFKFDNLLLHKFRLPKKKLTSLQFSYYISEQLNYLLPNLPIPMHWSYISDAHPLKTKSKNSNVIIIRFCNRNIRHMIYDHRDDLPGRLAITEHLTESNLCILKRAKDLFGFHNAWTDKCNIIVFTNGKTTKVNTIQDVNELFENTAIQPQNSNSSSTTNFNNHHRSPNNFSSNHKYSQKTTYAPSSRNWQSGNNRDYHPYNNFNNMYHNNTNSYTYPSSQRGCYNSRHFGNAHSY